jgi:hypothetical protein
MLHHPITRFIIPDRSEPPGIHRPEMCCPAPGEKTDTLIVLWFVDHLRACTAVGIDFQDGSVEKDAQLE